MGNRDSPRPDSAGLCLGRQRHPHRRRARRHRRHFARQRLVINYDYLVTVEVTKIRENRATSGVGVLATFGYDQLGRRTSLARGNATGTTNGYDPVSRLASLVQSLPGTIHDLTPRLHLQPGEPDRDHHPLQRPLQLHRS